MRGVRRDRGREWESRHGESEEKGEEDRFQINKMTLQETKRVCPLLPATSGEKKKKNRTDADYHFAYVHQKRPEG